MTLVVRDFRDADAEPAARLFFDAVREATGDAYDERQRRAWAPRVPETRAWRERLAAATTLVAEDDRGLAGFLSLGPAGHVDLVYVRVDRIGTGVAKALHDELVARGRAGGLGWLTTDASLTARPFFERQGWRVVREQQPVRDGVRLTNFRMVREL